MKTDALKDSPMFAFRHRNDDLAATLASIRGANIIGEVDTEWGLGIGTKGISAKKKAYLKKIELREAKQKAIEIDKLILIRD